MQEPLSQHHFPRPSLRRLISWLIGATIAVLFLLIVFQFALTLVFGPIFLGGACFGAILLIPLLMRTVLHPEIDVYPNGLLLHPMLWPKQYITWDAIKGVVQHPLIYNDEVLGRTLHGNNYQPHEGAVVLTSSAAKLWFPYRITGGVAGAGLTLAFAISSTTHTNYAMLLKTIEQNAGMSSKS